MIHDGDRSFLEDYCKNIQRLRTQPDEVRFFCSGVSNKCQAIIGRFGFTYQERQENSGFNESFNLAYGYALEHTFDWLITMTVRCRPNSDWMCKLNLENIPEGVGMVTTLTLKDDDKAFNLGHSLSKSHACFDFGQDVNSDKINEIEEDWFYCPCSGAAAYRVSALDPRAAFGEEGQPLNGALFKSYNCDALGYLVKANGYENLVNNEAVP